MHFGRSGLRQRRAVEIAPQLVGRQCERLQGTGGLTDGEEHDGDDDDQRKREIDVEVVRQRRRGGFGQGDKAHPLAVVEPDVEAARDVGVLHAPGAVHAAHAAHAGAESIARAHSHATAHATAHAGRADFTLAAEALRDRPRNLPARNVRCDLRLVDWRDLEVVGLHARDGCAPLVQRGGFENAHRIGDANSEVEAARLRDDRRAFAPVQPETHRLRRRQTGEQDQRDAREQAAAQRVAQAHSECPSTLAAST